MRFPRVLAFLWEGPCRARLLGLSVLTSDGYYVKEDGTPSNDSHPQRTIAHVRRLQRERMLTYAAGVLLVVGGLGLAVWTLWPYVSALAGPRLAFDETTHDFGAIYQTKEVGYDFTFTNTGNKTLHIGKIVPS